MKADNAIADCPATLMMMYSQPCTRADASTASQCRSPHVGASAFGWQSTVAKLPCEAAAKPNAKDRQSSSQLLDKPKRPIERWPLSRPRVLSTTNDDGKTPTLRQRSQLPRQFHSPHSTLEHASMPNC